MTRVTETCGRWVLDVDNWIVSGNRKVPGNWKVPGNGNVYGNMLLLQSGGALGYRMLKLLTQTSLLHKLLSSGQIVSIIALPNGGKWFAVQSGFIKMASPRVDAYRSQLLQASLLLGSCSLYLRRIRHTYLETSNEIVKFTEVETIRWKQVGLESRE